MYRHAKGSPTPSGLRGPRPPRYAVVAFWRRKTNTGKFRVFRRVWAFDTRLSAEVRFRLLSPRYPEHALVIDGQMQAGAVTGPLVAEWLASRRDVNRDADPWSAGPYASRERPENRSTTYREAATQRRWRC